MKDTPYLTHMGELWGVTCEYLEEKREYIFLRFLIQIQHDTAKLTSLDLTDDESTLVQVMAWCHQAPSHYLNQCWQNSMMPQGVISGQWVEPIILTFPPEDLYSSSL